MCPYSRRLTSAEPSEQIGRHVGRDQFIRDHQIDGRESLPRPQLERRLVGRGTEGPEERERRLATARVEMEAASEFDHVVINDDVDRAVSELAGLIGLE